MPDPCALTHGARDIGVTPLSDLGTLARRGALRSGGPSALGAAPQLGLFADHQP